MSHLTDERFVAAVDLAARAPSLHNSQPWRFRRDGDAIELHADPVRRLPITDPTGRAVRMSCGAALMNLRLALAAQGLSTAVTLVPDPTDPDLLARITVGSTRPASPDEAALAAAIPHRHSQRAPFVEAVVPTAHRSALTSAAERESAALSLVTDRAAAADIADSVRAAESALANVPGYSDELRAWTRAAKNGSGDGVPRSAGGPAPAAHEQLVRRDFGGTPAPEHRRYEAEPLLAVLCSHGDSPRDQLLAGQALQRVLLAATSAGLVASMFSQPIEIPQTREQVRHALKTTMEPQMVLRIGFGAPAAATPRRGAADVIDAPRIPL